MGDPASLRVFHAGRNYLRLRLATWGIAQTFALAGLLFWTALLIDVEITAQQQRASREQKAASTEPNQTAERTIITPKDARSRDFGVRLSESLRTAQKDIHLRGWRGFEQTLVELALLLPAGAFSLIWAIKIVSFAIYLIQIPLTYAVRRLDYEMRWYMVTDRSLRLRHGVWKVAETTMSFANIQQVVVSKGPLQGLLGLADVKVQSAGGASGGEKHRGKEDMHLGLFHSVTHAPEIRDLILERLRRFRETGLGDTSEQTLMPPLASTETSTAPAIVAARELLNEAKALRAVLH
jgi:membrane protein YdbS with pleckstrin-like domain